MFEERWQEMQTWGFPSVQNKEELRWLYDNVMGAGSYLEIGTSFGGSLWVIADALDTGAKIVSVDLPKYRSSPGKWARDRKHFERVDWVADELRKKGKDVHIIRADSHDANTRRVVGELGPSYDVCFIDGDHSAEGVKADYEDYSGMCRHAYFHDIAVPSVRAWWDTLKHEKDEFVKEYGMGAIL